MYKDYDYIQGYAIVVSNKIEKEYNKIYKIKMENNNTYLYLYVKNENLEYGNRIYVKGNFQKPEKSKNFGGFNYENYLRTLKIYGILKCDFIKIIEKNKINPILNFRWYIKYWRGSTRKF